MSRPIVKGSAVGAIAVAGVAAMSGCTPSQVADWTSSASSSGASSASSWAAGYEASAVRRCESGSNYATNTGNGYFGAYQFDIPSWYANGGGAYASRPDLAPSWAQDQVAYTYWSKAGWSPWECKP